MEVSFSPDITPSNRPGSKHQLTNQLIILDFSQINYWEDVPDPYIQNHYTGEANNEQMVIGLQANTWYRMDVQVTITPNCDNVFCCRCMDNINKCSVH